jgi:hypothetical protein
MKKSLLKKINEKLGKEVEWHHNLNKKIIYMKKNIKIIDEMSKNNKKWEALI